MQSIHTFWPCFFFCLVIFDLVFSVYLFVSGSGEDGSKEK